MHRPLLRKIFNPATIGLALLVALSLPLGLDKEQTQSVLSFFQTNQPGLYQVIEVSDGDTVVVDMNGVPERVRMIGIDTPEKNHPQKPVQCYAEAASNHLAGLIGDSQVRLEADPTNQNRDRYGRLLRYVYLPDGTLLNKRQISDGYAFAYLSFPFLKMTEFEAAEYEAQAAGRGLWSACDVYVENGYINTSEAY